MHRVTIKGDAPPCKDGMKPCVDLHPTPRIPVDGEEEGEEYTGKPELSLDH